MSDSVTPIDALIAQGCCCGSGCEKCPYTPAHQAGAVDLSQDWVSYQLTHPDISRDRYEEDKATGAT